MTLINELLVAIEDFHDTMNTKLSAGHKYKTLDWNYRFATNEIMTYQHELSSLHYTKNNKYDIEFQREEVRRCNIRIDFLKKEYENAPHGVW